MATKIENPKYFPVPPKTSWWKNVSNRVWGYDFFVSYHWDSGGAYAVKLAEDLRDRGFECFLDRSEFAGGDDWRTEAKTALDNTRRLIVVGTRQALSKSEPVRDEVSHFVSRSGHVIPILFGTRIEDDERHNYPALELISKNVVEVIEHLPRQAIGPSQKVLNSIESTHSVLRRRRLRGAIVASIIVTLAFLALIAFVSFLNAEMQRLRAQESATEAQRQLWFARQNEFNALNALASIAENEGRIEDAAKLTLAAWPRNQTEAAPQLKTTVKTLRTISHRQLANFIIEERERSVSSIALSADGSTLASGAADGTVLLWEVDSGTLIHMWTPLMARADFVLLR
ncbi:toll/interleukin-1 receptor domain-containing protein [Hoeflea sp.]|uniref:toll/interleukin-1 receptor domain-containing protein n=1 Tax=Hoeflea sp. TaxID=1940281 RepID=UPI003B02A9E3